MISKRTILLFACLGLGLKSPYMILAQDTVYTNSGKVIIGKILSNGPAEIRMQVTANKTYMAYYFRATEVDSIIYADGRKETPAFTQKNRLKQNIPQLNTLTLDPIALCFLTISVAYERRLKNGIIGFRVPLYIGFKGGQIPGFAGITRVQGPESNFTSRSGSAFATGLNPNI
jgi:hypothetical protein